MPTAEVEYAELDPIMYTATLPNDPSFQISNRVWHLTRIGAPAAWDTHQGSQQVRVCIIDTGVNYK